MKNFSIRNIPYKYDKLFVRPERQVNIEQDEKIEELLKLYKSSNSSSDYYRIQVGFGSHAKAQRIRSEVQIDFPQLSARIDSTPLPIGFESGDLKISWMLKESLLKYGRNTLMRCY